MLIIWRQETLNCKVPRLFFFRKSHVYMNIKYAGKVAMLIRANVHIFFSIFFLITWENRSSIHQIDSYSSLENDLSETLK